MIFTANHFSNILTVASDDWKNHYLKCNKCKPNQAFYCAEGRTIWDAYNDKFNAEFNARIKNERVRR